MTELFHVAFQVFVVSMLLFLKLNPLVSGHVLALSPELNTACSVRHLLLALSLFSLSLSQ